MGFLPSMSGHFHTHARARECVCIGEEMPGHAGQKWEMSELILIRRERPTQQLWVRFWRQRPASDLTGGPFCHSTSGLGLGRVKLAAKAPGTSDARHS
jgi:hypothetical protein